MYWPTCDFRSTLKIKYVTDLQTGILLRLKYRCLGPFKNFLFLVMVAILDGVGTY